MTFMANIASSLTSLADIYVHISMENGENKSVQLNMVCIMYVILKMF